MTAPLSVQVTVYANDSGRVWKPQMNSKMVGHAGSSPCRVRRLNPASRRRFRRRRGQVAGGRRCQITEVLHAGHRKVR